VYAARVARRNIAASLTLVLLSAGCSKVDVALEPSHDPFEILVSVVSDPGVALPGAAILSGNRVVGRTSEGGSAKLSIDGNEGDQVELSIRCPADYDSPAAPLVVSLKRFAAGSRPPQFEARCPPTTRTLVVGIRAENGPNLPVVYLGQVAAQTDESGAAVFMTKVKPADKVEVTLSTSEAAPGVKPQNPTLTFVAKDQDDFVVLEQAFTVPKKVAPIRVRPVHIPPGGPL